MENIKIKIIIGSVRENRFGDKPATWIYEIAKKQEGVEVEILDLKDYPLPFYKEPMSPSYITGEYPDPAVNKFAKKIAEADGFIVVTPEYNHSTSGVLKNAFDAVYKEWNNKAVGFVGYGSVGGARAVEHLRGVAVEVQMASVRNAVHINSPWELTNEDGTLKAGVLDHYEKGAENMISQLLVWTRAFKTIR